MSNAMNIATLLNADGTVKTTKYTAGAGGGGGGTTIVDNFAGLASLTGMTAGSQAYVTATNNLYFYTGSGWYLIATVQNDAPSAITGVEGSYSLAIDGTATTITAVSTDPEGFPLTWTYTASGLGSIATVAQADNVFTVTPSTDEANTGSFTLTISATDGINGAVSTIPSFALAFVIPNSKYTTLLAKAVSTGDNNNITDASSNNHTITVAGDTYAGSFSPYRHGGYSTHFDGASDYLEIYNDSSLVLAGSPWTIECWVKPSGNYSTYRTIFAKRAGTTSYEGYLRISTGVVSFYNGTNYESTTVLDANSWSHVAWVYDGANINIYVNGVRVLTSAVTITEYNHPIWIGGVTGHNEWFQGNIRDFRILKGTALYTGTTLTPPTEPLTDITNTSFLTCQSPYIVDGSTNAHDITVNGNVSTTPFNTYDYAAYSAGTNGGSVYFDGVGDYLDISNDASLTIGTGDFTSECWVFVESGATLMSYWRSCFSLQGDGNSNAGSISIYISNGVGGALGALVVIANDDSFRLHSTADVRGQWTHVAIARESGTLRFFVNGSLASSASDTTNYNATGPTRVGVSSTGQSNYWLGYVADARFVKGTAVYTAAFTPPTAPLSSSGSSLHIKGTDASIVDKSQTSNIKLVGNTTGSTTQVKFTDTKSMYFDTSGDYIITPQQELGTEDFTIEGWHYLLSRANTKNGIFGNYTSYTGGSLGMFAGHASGTATSYQVSYNGAAFPNSVIQGGTIVYNQWVHFAVVRNSGTMSLYIDGTSVGSISATASLNGVGSDFVVGSSADQLGIGIYGYLQDFRITNGLARYTANFTPPTESLKG